MLNLQYECVHLTLLYPIQSSAVQALSEMTAVVESSPRIAYIHKMSNCTDDFTTVP